MRITTLPAKTRSICSYAFFVTGLALAISLMTGLQSHASSGTPTPLGTPSTSSQSVFADLVLPPTEEGNAQLANIFIAEVVARAGEEEIPTTDPEDPYRLLLYDVNVQQTLKGGAAGEVRILYDDYNGEPSVQKLIVGERYLFFAGFDPDSGWYPVDAMAGVILIKNDRQQANLVATYEPLIRQVERTGEKPVYIDPCETPEEEPTLTVEPATGAPGDRVRLTGGPFVRAEAPVSWDGKGQNDYLRAAPVAEDCTIDVEITIPDAAPGEHRIIAYDAAAREAVAVFEVVEE